MPPDATLHDLTRRLPEAAPRDRGRLRARLRGLEKRAKKTPDARILDAIARDIDTSAHAWAARRAQAPTIAYPADLPVAQRKDEILAAIRDHQVVVICGETGSGKTTQLPKMLLELGLGVDRLIGHTQPRRIAARTVAARIAEETQTRMGDAVGCKVRFDDETSDATLVKLMTDGMLLAETRSDRRLDAYEAIIIDEAHERSLNIDFLLGCLRRILPRRPDLKVIITSATIDPERFAEHFAQADGTPAPIIEVSGRTYPVDVHYRPPAETEEQARLDDALHAVMDEIDTDERGDVLIFMPGEREIRETTRLLRNRYEQAPSVEVLPLYARLSPADQQRIFKPHRGTRIVVATNVAETSLTVPGIRYVIDPGTARISRYSARSKMQALPIEPISRASADQRKGRCGRVGPGVCYRLYAETDFDTRDEFTAPEVKRTSLASVVLQMADLGLGRPEDFPFVERPELRQIRDGYQTLRELGAVDETDALTPMGRQLARLPVDPRIARMILAAAEENCVHDVLIIAAALTVPDPRDRPYEKRDAADEAHAEFAHPDSDFLAYLKIWDFYHDLAAKLSRSKLAKACQQKFLSQRRIGEWRLLYRQLRTVASSLDIDPGHGHAEPEAVHRALLSGLLANAGHKKDTSEYAGTRGAVFHLFPGSSLFEARPKWVMAAEIVRTTRVYARCVARIKPEWIEQVGEHLIERTHSDPRWDERSSRVVANERALLLGLEIVRARVVSYGKVDAPKARELFIHHALVEGEYDTPAPAIAHNRALAEHVRTLEDKARRADLLADAHARFRFYDERLPADISSGQQFDAWLRRAERDTPGVLHMTEADLLVGDAGAVTPELYPDAIDIGSASVPLAYRFEPGADDDGVTIRVPTDALANLRDDQTEWAVGGQVPEKLEALIRTLPKAVRRQFDAGPLAKELAPTLPRDRPVVRALAEALTRRSGVRIDEAMFRPADLPTHLTPRYEVVDEQGERIDADRDLARLRRDHAPDATPGEIGSTDLGGGELHRDGVTAWDFDDLPETITFERAGAVITGYPALVDQGEGVGVRVMESKELARVASRRGLARLFVRHLRDSLRFSAEDLPGFGRAALLYAPLGAKSDLAEDVAVVLAERVFVDRLADVRTREQFKARVEEGWNRLGPAADEVGKIAQGVLENYQRVAMRLDDGLPEAWAGAERDIRAQIARLVYPRVFRDTPYEWLRCLPRYLQAIEVRLDRLRTIGPARDAERMAPCAAWERARVQRAADHEAQGIRDAGLTEFRWLTEELRVAQFAQELGTAVKVSPARLEKAWARVRA
ncbi:MAG: ATP-dependent helicase [Phycisphaeraceae bacterium]|nr:MAG: ATP-dependent helicase [Phycisphaeraceae bacterium]